MPIKHGAEAICWTSGGGHDVDRTALALQHGAEVFQHAIAGALRLEQFDVVIVQLSEQISGRQPHSAEYPGSPFCDVAATDDGAVSQLAEHFQKSGCKNK